MHRDQYLCSSEHLCLFTSRSSNWSCFFLQFSDQLEAAFKFLSNCGEQPVDWKKLEESAGIGVEVSHQYCKDFHNSYGICLCKSPSCRAYIAGQVTPVEIAEEVAKVLSANKDQLVAER